MGAENLAQTAGGSQEVRTPLAAATVARENRFWYGVALAAALHAALIFVVTRSASKQLGERGGRPDGINVVLVDAADLDSKNTLGQEKTSAPSAMTPPQAQQPPPPKKSPVPAPKEAPPAESAEAAPPLPRALEEQKDTARAIDKEALEQVPQPGQGAKQSEPRVAARPPPKTELQQTTPPPQLTIPNIPVAPGDRGAAMMRPPGATRSGENDEFGRGVIRALRQTMPGHSGQFGRVTIRLFLSDKGNIEQVQLVRGSGISGLDQVVTFAVRQASFPIPPAGSPIVDRTFLVTYIYN